MRKYIFPIIKRKKEEESEKRGRRIPLRKELPVEVELPEDSGPVDIDGNDGVIDFNINDPKNIVNNLRL